MKPAALAFLLAIALAVGACGDDDGTTTTSSAGAGEITISGFSFGNPITVAVGDTVTVRNQDATAHTWTSRIGLFSSGNIAGGAEFSYAFEAAGEYEFFCGIHPDMTGSITVTG